MVETEEIIKTRSVANKMLNIEAATVILCGLLFLVFASLEYAYSVILGGLSFIVPNVIFVMFSLGATGAGSSRKTLAFFLVGEAVKIVTTIAIFAITIMSVEALYIGIMFLSYGFVLLMNLTGLMVLTNK